MTRETVEINTRSITSALRDFATLLERGSTDFVIEGLRSLANRVEDMAEPPEYRRDGRYRHLSGRARSEAIRESNQRAGGDPYGG